MVALLLDMFLDNQTPISNHNRNHHAIIHLHRLNNDAIIPNHSLAVIHFCSLGILLSLDEAHQVFSLEVLVVTTVVAAIFSHQVRVKEDITPTSIKIGILNNQDSLVGPGLMVPVTVVGSSTVCR